MIREFIIFAEIDIKNEEILILIQRCTITVYWM